MGIKTGGKLVYNLRNEDDIRALYSHHFIDIKCENTKLLKVGEIQSDAGAMTDSHTVDDVHIEVAEHFKYMVRTVLISTLCGAEESMDSDES